MASTKQQKELEKKTDDVMLSVMKLLNKKGLLVEDKGLQYPDNKIVERIEEAGNIAKIFKPIITDTKQFSRFRKNMKKFGFKEKDLKRMFFLISVQNLLWYYEFSKKYLISIMNTTKLIQVTKKVKKNGKHEIITSQIQFKKSDMFGEVLKKLTQILDYDGLYNLFNHKLRNALAHNDWWFNDENFVYRYKNSEGKLKEDELTVDEFFGEIVLLGTVMKSTGKTYWQVKYPGQPIPS